MRNTFVNFRENRLRLYNQVVVSALNLIIGSLAIWSEVNGDIVVFFLSLTGLASSLFSMHWERSRQVHLVPAMSTLISIAVFYFVVMLSLLMPLKSICISRALIVSTYSVLIGLCNLLNQFFAVRGRYKEFWLLLLLRFLSYTAFALWVVNDAYIPIYIMFFVMFVILSLLRRDMTKGFNEDYDTVLIHSVEYPKNQLWIYGAPMLGLNSIIAEIYFIRQSLSLLSMSLTYLRTIFFDTKYRNNTIVKYSHIKKRIYLMTLLSAVLMILGVFFENIYIAITLSWLAIVLLQDAKAYINRLMLLKRLDRLFLLTIVLVIVGLVLYFISIKVFLSVLWLFIGMYLAELMILMVGIRGTSAIE